MSTPTQEVSGEKGQVSIDLNEFYEDWISNVVKMAEWLENFSNQHFPSSIQEKISDMEYQIHRCIQTLESVPQGKRQLEYECLMFEYLKGRLYNAIPDVYKEEAECHLVKATQLNPFLLEAWDCLGRCVSKKGDYKRAKKCYKFVLNMDKGNSIILRRLADLELMLEHSECKSSVFFSLICFVPRGISSIFFISLQRLFAYIARSQEL
ncbi:hypothetical protein RDI58_004236 [Solanum bulbocastanum]|uniref:Tetratricopeptide repeat protein n=1 Tax=Solanum bulbocastanum TaxID=147425 RepID=A0AAN8TYR5_SOLBU